jgi:hypothetical protein
MTIQSDPLKRWWLNLDGENRDQVSTLRPILLAVLGFGRQREAQIAGTAFIVAGESEFAVAFTAKHVLSEGVARIQKPEPLHASSALFVPSSRHLPSLEATKAKFLWMGDQNALALNGVHSNMNDTLDIASILVMPQEGESKKFQPPSILLDTTVPMLGEEIVMVSLLDMSVEETQPPEDKTGKGQALRIARRVSIRMGVVTGIYPRGFRQYKWPCFTTSIPAEPGMSGGFVAVWRPAEKTAACGVVCADNSTESARRDYRLPGESVIACTWPTLGMPFPDAIPWKAGEPTSTLREMIASGRMPIPIGGIDHIEIAVEENGDYTVLNTKSRREEVMDLPTAG